MWTTTAAASVPSARKGRDGEIYNIGGNRSLPNLDVVRRSAGSLPASPRALIQYVKDRPGHDTRYALSSRKIYEETGWQPQMTFDEGLRATVEWYQENRTWIERVRSGEYQTFYDKTTVPEGTAPVAQNRVQPDRFRASPQPFSYSAAITV